jgi:hypothetical protein
MFASQKGKLRTLLIFLFPPRLRAAIRGYATPVENRLYLFEYLSLLALLIIYRCTVHLDINVLRSPTDALIY